MTTPQPIPCPTCRYNLRGLAHTNGATCPECGGTFKVVTSPVIANVPLIRERLLLTVLLATPLVIIAAVPLATLTTSLAPRGWRLSIAIVTIVPFALWNTLLLRTLRRDVAKWARTNAPDVWVALGVPITASAMWLAALVWLL